MFVCDNCGFLDDDIKKFKNSKKYNGFFCERCYQNKRLNLKSIRIKNRENIIISKSDYCTTVDMVNLINQFICTIKIDDSDYEKIKNIRVYFKHGKLVINNTRLENYILNSDSKIIFKNGDNLDFTKCNLFDSNSSKNSKYYTEISDTLIPIEQINKKVNNCFLWRIKCLNCGNEYYYSVPSKIIGNKFCDKCFIHVKHGKSGSRIYRTRRGMIDRCSNEKSKGYKRYGGRGIKVCEEWLGENGFENFYNWAIENGYTDNLTIDRINNDGDYEPSNCRWITTKEQNRNTSKNLKFKAISPTGEKYEDVCLSKFAENHNLNYSSIVNYLYGKQKTCNGWYFEVLN